MKFNVLTKIALSGAILLVSSSTFASDCLVNISEVSSNANGRITINIRSADNSFSNQASIQLCNLLEDYTDPTTNRVHTPFVCTMWTSTLQRAQAANKPVAFFMPGSCSDLAGSNNPSPYSISTLISTNTSGAGTGGSTTFVTDPAGITEVTGALTSSSAYFSWTNSTTAPGPYWLEIFDTSNNRVWGDDPVGFDTDTTNFPVNTLTSGTSYNAILYLNAVSGGWGNKVYFSFTMP